MNARLQVAGSLFMLFMKVTKAQFTIHLVLILGGISRLEYIGPEA